MTGAVFQVNTLFKTNRLQSSHFGASIDNAPIISDLLKLRVDSSFAGGCVTLQLGDDSPTEMAIEMSDEHLSEIQTLWSVVRRAHGDQSVEAESAQQTLIDRYGGAIQRYLLGAFRDQTAADDAYQEFALRFLKGDYKSADPDKGRFRSFLKTILYRLVIEHHRGQKRRKSPQMASEFPEPAVFDESISDETFQRTWRDEMLQRAWDALKSTEEESGRPLFTVLRARVDQPDAGSAELAEQLSDELGKNVTSANVRVMLHRARDQFGHLLFNEVSDTIDSPTRDAVEEELIDLGLLEYCRPVLQRMDAES